MPNPQDLEIVGVCLQSLSFNKKSSSYKKGSFSYIM